MKKIIAEYNGCIYCRIVGMDGDKVSLTCVETGETFTGSLKGYNFTTPENCPLNKALEGYV